MGELQQRVNIKILENMAGQTRLNSYKMEGTRLVVESSEVIKSKTITQDHINIARINFHNDQLIQIFCT